MTRGLALQICRIYVAVSLAGDKSPGWTAERLDHPAKEQKLSSGDLMLHVGIREGAKQYNRIVGRWPCGSVKEGLERCESRKEMVNSLQQHLWPRQCEGRACLCLWRAACILLLSNGGKMPDPFISFLTK